jgi:hypothetical protein
MKRLLFLLLFPLILLGQGQNFPSGGSGGLTQVSSLPGTCVAGAQYQLPSGQVFTCGPANTYTPNPPAVLSGVVQSGLIAEYRILPSESAAALVDYSGNGNTATGTTGTAPTIIPLTGGINCAGTGGINLPASLNAARTVQVFLSFDDAIAVPIPLSFTSTQVIFGGSSGTATSAYWNLYRNISGDTWGLALEGGSRFRSGYGSGTYLTAVQGAFNGTATVGWVMGANDSFYQNALPFLNIQSGASAGLQTAGNYQLCTAAGVGTLTAKVYYVVVYNRALNSTEIAQNAAFINNVMASRGVPSSIGGTDNTDQAIVDGDSIAAAAGWPLSLLTGTYAVSDEAWNGGGIVGGVTYAPTAIDTLYRPIAARNVVAEFYGSNDVNAPLEVAYIRSYCAARKAVGLKCLVGTMVSRTTKEAYKDQLNAQLRQLWPTFADGLVDLAANVNLGADGACSNITYFNADCIHLQPFTNTYLWGAAAVHAINRVMGNPLNGTPSIYTGTGVSVPYQTGLGLQTTGASGASGNPVNSAFPFNNASGNFIFVVVGCTVCSAGNPINTPTDTAGNTYNSVSPAVTLGVNSWIQAFYAMNIAAGVNTIHANFTGSMSNVYVQAREWAGVATAAALDAASVIATGVSTSPASANITTTAASELVIGYGGTVNGNANPWTLGAGFLYDNQLRWQMEQYKIAGAAGSYNSSATIPTSDNWGMGVVAFKTVTGATTYPLQDYDVASSCTPTSGNVILLLDDASWQSGQSKTVTNTSASGAFSCTVNGTTPPQTGVAQNIDGAASIVIPPLSTVTFTSLLTFTGVAGTNLSPVNSWHATTISNLTSTNCAINSASPGACGSAASGAFVVPTTTGTYTVNTTAVTANSVILITPRTYTGDLPSTPTCVVPTITAEPVVSAIVAGTSFTITLTSTTGQTCWNYRIIN